MFQQYTSRNAIDDMKFLQRYLTGHESHICIQTQGNLSLCVELCFMGSLGNDFWVVEVKRF